MGEKKVLACSGDLRLVSNYRLYPKPPAFRAGFRTGINSIRLNLDAAGTLYGITSQAGTYGCGTVFRLTKSATGCTESLLHILPGGSDGNFPVASVIFDRAGNLYGTTEFGGIQNQDGYGTIFKTLALWRYLERSRSPSLQQR
jgi:uncharacterized repeat protein (TIGR03803 family)